MAGVAATLLYLRGVDIVRSGMVSQSPDSEAFGSYVRRVGHRHCGSFLNSLDDAKNTLEGQTSVSVGILLVNETPPQTKELLRFLKSLTVLHRRRSLREAG